MRSLWTLDPAEAFRALDAGEISTARGVLRQQAKSRLIPCRLGSSSTPVAGWLCIGLLAWFLQRVAADRRAAATTKKGSARGPFWTRCSCGAHGSARSAWFCSRRRVWNAPDRVKCYRCSSKRGRNDVSMYVCSRCIIARYPYIYIYTHVLSSHILVHGSAQMFFQESSLPEPCDLCLSGALSAHRTRLLFNDAQCSDPAETAWWLPFLRAEGHGQKDEKNQEVATSF